MEMLAPRNLRISAVGKVTRLRPLKRISLPGRMMAFSFGNRPRIDNAVTDLPLPDSPTSATVLCAGTSKLTPLTASNSVCLSRRKFTRRLRTLRRVSLMVSSSAWLVVPAKAGTQCLLGRWVPAFAGTTRVSFQFRIERVAQRIRQHAERRHQYRHRRAGRRQLPPVAQYQFVLRFVQHRAPGDHVHRYAETQEAQDHF